MHAFFAQCQADVHAYRHGKAPWLRWVGEGVAEFFKKYRWYAKTSPRGGFFVLPEEENGRHILCHDTDLLCQ